MNHLDSGHQYTPMMEHYRQFKSYIQRQVWRAYCDYIEGIITPSTTESQQELSKTNKHFWNFIRHQKQDAPGMAALKRDGVLTDDTVAKGNSRLGFLKRNLKEKSLEVKEKSYKALIHPTLEYCCSVWDPPTKTQSQRVDMVQHRAARWVTGHYHNTPIVNNMLRNLE